MEDVTTTALNGMQEAHSAKLWGQCVALGDAWLEARGRLPTTAAILYAEALMCTGRIEEAVMWANQAVTAKTEGTLKVAALTTLGRALSRAGEYAGSRKVLNEAADVPATDDETREKQGHIMLSLGRSWRKGWKLHEARLSTEERKLPPNMRPWDGKEAGPVSVLHEQGIGDAVLAARWLPWLVKKTGHPVTYYGPPLLHRWIGGLPGVLLGDLSVDMEKLDGGMAIRAMSLPYFARCDSPESIPKPVAPESLRIEREAFRNSRVPFTVGVCWKGSTAGWHDFERSYKADEFARIWRNQPDIRFVSLQHDEEPPQGAPFEKQTFTDAYHTGEVVSQCHLVISVDTAVVHIAGSLGVPVLCLVPTVADWRYDWPSGHATPWYSSITVLRRPNAYALNALDAARNMMIGFAEQVDSRMLA